ncbi:MAG TPA: hypothetical protein VNP03_12355 [Pseudonocardia sp.]|nr:hypothetical protein [Pseudonocardia sp.]
MRSGIRFFLALVLAAAPVFASTSPAYADAYGITALGAFDYTFQGLKFTVPNGFFFQHAIHGSGLVVTHEQADIVAMGPAVAESDFCNWRIDFQYEDADGKIYRTDRGPLATTCGKYDIYRAIPETRTLPSYGRSCAIFYVNGAERVRQCHFIVKPS